MRAPRSYRARSLSIAMTPMIDMAFLLITFFVMSMRLVRIGEEEVELPRADRALLAQPTRVGIATVVIPPDGALFLNGGPIASDELASALSALREGDPGLRVMIRADAEGEFGLVQSVLKACAVAGIRNIEFSVLKERNVPGRSPEAP